MLDLCRILTYVSVFASSHCAVIWKSFFISLHVLPLCKCGSVHVLTGLDHLLARVVIIIVIFFLFVLFQHSILGSVFGTSFYDQQMASCQTSALSQQVSSAVWK